MNPTWAESVCSDAPMLAHMSMPIGAEALGLGSGALDSISSFAKDALWDLLMTSVSGSMGKNGDRNTNDNSIDSPRGSAVRIKLFPSGREPCIQSRAAPKDSTGCTG